MSAAGVLFLPIRIGETGIRDRMAMAPMTREFSADGVPGVIVSAVHGAGREIMPQLWHVGVKGSATAVNR
ncbi:hypothetical protein V474_05380 [Novosphingobium barchaimii LL02]|uniref:NADH:flavin oxidoreductase/NADH oxidase N-terminal domain-containing protein n=1 Tax=Novosphingobium barchaimii LL02 TaxID=1114963 RepID=A0A0J7XGN4_9SPHN|nr:hypothetical protein [Novosphingobium barchaimii]KMS50932.1 hypothetical protein V474_05380 [Novosphingobium barchaimii LL02]